MGSLVVGDLMLLFFSIYISVFFRYFHSPYPDMSIGFHLWEVCYNKETWYYGNKLASRIGLILGLIFFALIYPLLLYLGFKRSYLVAVLLCFFVLYFVLLFVLVKIWMRKKFDLKDK